MTYYTALADADYMGFYNVGRHSTQKAAIAALRRKLAGSTAEAGIVATSEPKWDDAFKSRMPGYITGVMRKGIHPTKRISVRTAKLPDVAYYYQRAGKKGPEYLVGYDGSLTKYEKR